MKSFTGLTKRNLLVFFKDRQSVLFSLLTSIIVLALYLLFLKGTFVDAMTGVTESYPGLSTIVTDNDINMFANLVLLTGIIGSAMITVSYNCLTTVVNDREKKIDYDILSTPIKRWQIILSYFTAAALSSMILTGVILTAGLCLIGLQGDLHLEALDILKAYGTVALGSVSATAFFMIPVLSFKTTSASGAFFGILSAASGFVIGAYIPISQFSGSVQTLCNLFPASHITIMIRNIFMNGILGHIDHKLAGIDGGMFATTIRELFSFKAHLFESDFGMIHMLIYVLAALGVCLTVQTVIFAKTYKK
ncbi:MAG: ABC transporter permease [Lachnospiraceae bacterium]|nr:ABC transporter permease [Lachnospiraceae bacterium]